MRDATARTNAFDETLSQARTSISEIAESLQEILGQKLTAYSVGLADGRDIGRFARGEREPGFATQAALRDLNYVVTLLKSKEDIGTIRNWLVGMNPMLSDRSPASLLKEGTEEKRQLVAAAARKFLNQG